MKNNIQQTSFLSNLIQGDISLWKTYWLFGVIGNIIATTLINIFSQFSETSFFIILIIAIAYKIGVFTAIWNSASKYVGLKIWAILAKIMVVLGFISILTIFNL